MNFWTGGIVEMFKENDSECVNETIEFKLHHDLNTANLKSVCISALYCFRNELMKLIRFGTDRVHSIDILASKVESD